VNQACRDHAASIPWYANGTLPEAEHEALAKHLEGCAECRALLAQARLQTRRPSMPAQGAHVPSALLIRFNERPRSLEKPTRSWIEEHLAHCESCAADLQLVRQSGEASPTAAEPGAGWRGWLATALRPGPALAYLLLLLIGVPLLWQARRPTSSPVVFDSASLSLRTESSTRGGERPEPARIPPAAGPARLDLQLEWEPAELASVDRLEIELRHGERSIHRMTRIPADLDAAATGLRLTIWFDPGGLDPGTVYEWTITAAAPGHPLDGQVLFRRQLKVAP
jgi:hypothetical protein